MSLTSYRAAPPRVNSLLRPWAGGFELFAAAKAPPELSSLGSARVRGLKGLLVYCAVFVAVVYLLCFEPVLGRLGGDRLSHALRRSTIGAEGFHVRVRDGIGCFTFAVTTKPSKNRARSTGWPRAGTGLNWAVQLRPHSPWRRLGRFCLLVLSFYR